MGLLTPAIPVTAGTESGDPLKKVLAADKERAQALLVRLDEIKSIDKSALNRDEKRKLRKEVRQIKSELNDIGGGVYLSAGAIILILILLIIFV
jgi:hypothetical protein